VYPQAPGTRGSVFDCPLELLSSRGSSVSAYGLRFLEFGIGLRSMQKYLRNTGLLKKKYTLSIIYFTKITDAKSMSCVRIGRKYLKVLLSMI
jgi:hypothetical protein